MKKLISSINSSKSKVMITWHIMWEILFRWMQRRRLSSFETSSSHNPLFQTWLKAKLELRMKK